jgi:hypothetical protein
VAAPADWPAGRAVDSKSRAGVQYFQPGDRANGTATPEGGCRAAIWVVSHGLCIAFQVEVTVPRMLSAKILRLIANCVRHLIQLQRDARSVAISSSKTHERGAP